MGIIIISTKHPDSKNVANGMAGLDSNILLSPAVIYPIVEEYSNHLGATDNFTEVGTSGNSTAIEDATNHEMDLSTGISAIGYGGFYTKKSFVVSTYPIITNFLIQNIVNGAGGLRSVVIGLGNIFSSTVQTDQVAFVQYSDNTWVARTAYGGSGAHTIISALNNGDLLTIVYITGEAKFYVNGTLVATRTSFLPSASLKVGAAVGAVNSGVSSARSISIDMLGYRKYL